MPVSRYFTIGLLIAVFAAPALAKQNPSAKPQTSPLQKTFQAIYHRIDQAWITKNLNGFAAYYCPDFVDVDVDNKLSNAAQARSGILSMFGEDSAMQARTTVESAKPWGKGVVVLAQTLLKYDTDGGTLHMKVIETDEDYWIKSSGAWKLKQEDELSILTWHNGKPYEK